MTKKSLKNQVIERRQSPRERLETMVKLVAKENEIEVKSENLSLTGLFLKFNSNENCQIDETVEVKFIDKQGCKQEHIGTIVRKSGDGIGIMYKKEQ